MFAYSLRERTHAARHLHDDVPEAVKQRRLQEVIATFRYSMPGRIRLEQQLSAGARHTLPDVLAYRRSLPPSGTDVLCLGRVFFLAAALVCHAAGMRCTEGDAGHKTHCLLTMTVVASFTSFPIDQMNGSTHTDRPYIMGKGSAACLGSPAT